MSTKRENICRKSAPSIWCETVAMISGQLSLRYKFKSKDINLSPNFGIFDPLVEYRFNFPGGHFDWARKGGTTEMSALVSVKKRMYDDLPVKNNRLMQ